MPTALFPRSLMSQVEPSRLHFCTSMFGVLGDPTSAMLKGWESSRSDSHWRNVSRGFASTPRRCPPLHSGDCLAPQTSQPPLQRAGAFTISTLPLASSGSICMQRLRSHSLALPFSDGTSTSRNPAFLQDGSLGAYFNQDHSLAIQGKGAECDLSAPLATDPSRPVASAAQPPRPWRSPEDFAKAREAWADGMLRAAR